MQAAIPGFEGIHRYWDPQRETVAAKILPGEFYVTSNDEIIVTLLGSCVSACICDRSAGIGGMNHFLLPEFGGRDAGNAHSNPASAAARYGNYAMEILINELLRNGASRASLELKVFGGGRILLEEIDVGRQNIAFVEEYVRTERLHLAAGDLGGPHPRMIVYSPVTGRARVRKLPSIDRERVARREASYRRELHRRPKEGSIELF